MSKKFKFDQEDLDRMVIEALDEDEAAPGNGKVKEKPNIVERLLTQSKLMPKKGNSERI